MLIDLTPSSEEKKPCKLSGMPEVAHNDQAETLLRLTRYAGIALRKKSMLILSKQTKKGINFYPLFLLDELLLSFRHIDSQSITLDVASELSRQHDQLIAGDQARTGSQLLANRMFFNELA